MSTSAPPRLPVLGGGLTSPAGSLLVPIPQNAYSETAITDYSIHSIFNKEEFGNQRLMSIYTR